MFANIGQFCRKREPSGIGGYVFAEIGRLEAANIGRHRIASGGHGIYQLTISGEYVSVDHEAAEKFIDEFAKIARK